MKLMVSLSSFCSKCFNFTLSNADDLFELGDVVDGIEIPFLDGGPAKS